MESVESPQGGGALTRHELSVLLLLAGIQFLSMLDFELMMPVGTFIGADLHVNASQLGELVSAYTLAAMLGSLLYARFADHWEKRAALCWSMAGLALGTLACGLAQGYGQLLAARLLAGFMAGPAGSAVMAIVGDVVVEQRRGRAIGVVMAGFTAASVAGLPLAVWMAGAWGWRPPFLILAGIGAGVIVAGRLMLPRAEPHPDALSGEHGLPPLTRQPAVLMAWAAVAVMMAADFAFVPFLPSVLTGNLGLAKADLGWAYFAGGLTTLVTFNLSGRWTDRWGATPVVLAGSLATMAVIAVCFLGLQGPVSRLAGAAVLAALFFANAPRVLAAFALFTKVPAPAQRASFQAMQTVIQHGSIGLATLLASQWISGEAGGAVEHVGRLVAQNWIAVVLSFFLIWRLERRLNAAPAAAPSLEQS
jgi:predicted MFS family arabinose efflux permease